MLKPLYSKFLWAIASSPMSLIFHICNLIHPLHVNFSMYSIRRYPTSVIVFLCQLLSLLHKNIYMSFVVGIR
jgi:hypothetical protein